MNIAVARRWLTQNSTIGELGVEGVFFCYTLEPRMDRSQGKPYAIQAGTYFLDVILSPHFTALFGFNFYTPRVLGVPGFDPETVEVHPGNSPAGTHGCTEVGLTRATDWVGGSDIAFGRLLAKLKAVPSAPDLRTLMSTMTPGLPGQSITYIDAMPVTDPEIGV